MPFTAYLSQLKESHLSQLEEPHLNQSKEPYLSQLKELYLGQVKESFRDRHKFHFITPSHRRERVSQVARTFQNLLKVQWNNVIFKEGIEDLQAVLSLLRDDPLRREVWRLQDLCEGSPPRTQVTVIEIPIKRILLCAPYGHVSNYYVQLNRVQKSARNAIASS